MTGLGMTGHDDLGAALEARPGVLVSASPETWATLDQLHAGGRYRQEFESAWRNGRAFFEARDGLRGRRPLTVEWKGSHRAPGDEVVPADLRVDHVFLISCKYLSRIVLNASPASVFDRLLAGAQGQRSGSDWFGVVAPLEYQRLFDAACVHAGLGATGADVLDAPSGIRRALRSTLSGRWPAALDEEVSAFCAAVSVATATRWRETIELAGGEERVLWRLLRISSAPYFVLGSDRDRMVRLRIMTPWDWRGAFRLERFDVEAQVRGQPTVSWRAEISERRSSTRHEVRGHVEVRWSHGKFAGPPEAKVYLDTPHHRVPGYVPLT